MENASKALIMAGSILIALLVIGMLVLGYRNISSLEQQKEDSEGDMSALDYMRKFEQFNRTLYGSELLSLANEDIENIKYIIPHQSNMKIMKAISTRLKIEENKLFTNIENIGNTFCASIPIALNEIMENKMLKSGDKIILLGYGGGLNTGSILLEI